MSERIELPTAERCETCRFWLRTDRGDMNKFEQSVYMSDEVDDLVQVGQCRRNPPVLTSAAVEHHDRLMRANHGFGSDPESVGATSQAVWPRTWDFDWCGEYQPATVAPPATPVG